ncbi:MAG: hypothetical protein FWE35_10260 [Streptosporangiales bacterium]|jgi:hypothetical protein|nr:hypothetical protein [Streptosporangiales bacterium]
MWQAIVFTFLGGLLAANGFPHFVRGITKRRYPCVFGNGPVTNLLMGWASFVIAAVFFYFSHMARCPGWSFGATAIGVLLMGLFHAGPGAFGRREPDKETS